MLPQRRKSAEEIAKMREAMGVPGEAPAPETPVEQASSSVDPAPMATQERAAVPAPAAVPVLPEPARELARPKAVKSLRKSERAPLSDEALARRAAAAAASGPIPAVKHSERDLMEMRRQAAAPPDPSISYIRNLAAPLWLIAGMYLLAILAAFTGWAFKHFYESPPLESAWLASIFASPSSPQNGKIAMVSLAVLALLVAGWIAWKKPRSRHHAGFVTIIAVLVVTFGLISQQPLTNGP